MSYNIGAFIVTVLSISIGASVFGYLKKANMTVRDFASKSHYAAVSQMDADAS